MTAEESGDKRASISEASDGEYDPQYSPIVNLPEVFVPTHEEDEVEILKLRAKLYRFDRTGTVPEWKERGTGEIKMLKHEANNTVRIVMRRDKTLKVCANHFITPLMELKPKPGQDKVFIYTSPADFAYEAVQSETFAIKFGTIDFANQFMSSFVESQKYVKEECKLYNGRLDAEETQEEAELEYEDEDSDEDDEDENYIPDTREDGEAENSAGANPETTQTKEENVAQIASKLQELNVNVQNDVNVCTLAKNVTTTN